MARQTKALATLQQNGIMSRTAEAEMSRDSAAEFVFAEVARAQAIIKRTRLLAQMLGVESEFEQHLRDVG